jgi:hypothetical protein
VTASRRDYVFAGDVARNVAALTTRPVGPVNIGTAIETDVNTLYAHLRPDRRLHQAQRPGQGGREAPGASPRSRAAEVPGWRPEMPLEEGLRRNCRVLPRPVVVLIRRSSRSRAIRGILPPGKIRGSSGNFSIIACIDHGKRLADRLLERTGISKATWRPS